MAISNHLAVSRWAEQITGEAPTYRGRMLSMEGNSVYAAGDTIYSYGRHFPMAVIMNGFVLVNGDRFSPTTNNHQGMVRGKLHGVEKLIVPFSALGAANIERASIRPVEICDDTWTEQRSIVGRDQLEWRRYDTDAKEYVETGGHYWDGRHREPQTPTEVSPGKWEVIRWRHWLGEAVFTAKVNGRRRYFLSAFDHNEARETYFLCELPGPAESVAEAFENLAPDIVKLALARDIAVKRQGDIFAIPCELPAEIDRPAPFKRGTEQYQYVPYRASEVRSERSIHPGRYYAPGGEDAPQWTRPRWATWRYEGVRKNQLLGTDHTATEVLEPATGETYARGIMRHEPSRAADHARIRLDGWHLIVPNTCPR